MDAVDSGTVASDRERRIASVRAAIVGAWNMIFIGNFFAAAGECSRNARKTVLRMNVACRLERRRV